VNVAPVLLLLLASNASVPEVVSLASTWPTVTPAPVSVG